MDNLLDALSKGTAFNVREGARKRTPRTTGGKYQCHHPSYRYLLINNWPGRLLWGQLQTITLKYVSYIKYILYMI